MGPPYLYVHMSPPNFRIKSGTLNGTAGTPRTWCLPLVAVCKKPIVKVIVCITMEYESA